MKASFLLSTDATVVAAVLFFFMLFSIYFGTKLRKFLSNHSELKTSKSGVNYLSGLLFFLLAITFSMGGSRFDQRRSLVIEESNAIGTALLRADLYSAQDRIIFRKDFQNYIETRISYYQSGSNLKAVLRADSLSHVVSNKIWEHAARLSKDPANDLATRLMIPALNDVIDVSTKRLYSELAKVPESIVWMLLILACINAFFIGYSSEVKGKKDWLIEIGFCLLVSVVVLYTLDIDRPRRGFVSLDMPNKSIIELRQNFK